MLKILPPSSKVGTNAIPSGTICAPAVRCAAVGACPPRCAHMRLSPSTHLNRCLGPTIAPIAGASGRRRPSDMPELKTDTAVVLASPYSELQRGYLRVPNGARGVIVAPTPGGSFLIDFENSAFGARDRTRVEVPAHWLRATG